MGEDTRLHTLISYVLVLIIINLLAFLAYYISTSLSTVYIVLLLSAFHFIFTLMLVSTPAIIGTIYNMSHSHEWAVPRYCSIVSLWPLYSIVMASVYHSIDGEEF